MKIDADKSLPKYLQLKEILKQYLSENYQAGQKILTETECVDRFDVSRNTVRQAVGELVSEGILSKEQGRGTFFLGAAPVEDDGDALLGVVMSSSSYIYSHILQGINEAASKKHYHIVLGTSDTNPDKELASLELLLNKNIDGLLFEPTGAFKQVRDAVFFQFLKELNIPVVLMGWAIEELELSYVSLDDVEVGFRATNYLIKAGHRKIACIYPNDLIPGIQRCEGYKKALDLHGIEHDPRFERSTSILPWQTMKPIYSMTKELLELGNERPSAIFYFNDMSALRGYVAIREAGLKIPEDISIISCDNFEYSALADVPLTSVIHPQERIGMWAAEILLDEIRHPGKRTPRQVIIKPSIAIRDSVRSLNEMR